MVETLIYEDEMGTAYAESFNCYVAAIEPSPFSLTVGEQYKVVWDGQSYDVEAADSSAVAGEVYIGNGTPLGLAGNDEPFVVMTTGTGVVFAALTDTETTLHTVAVYHVTEDEPSVDPEEPEEPVVQEGIVLKDRNGNDVAYYGIETVTFDTTTEGKQQTYTKGVAVEGLEIVPDFSGGDMAITAPDGTLVKSATIKKPDTLTPENVRNGVEVGGVVGTFIGDTEAAEVELSMADGDMVIEPSAEDKVLSSVTVKKPETLIPENILEGVEIAGIIGTHSDANIVAKEGTYTATGTGELTITHDLGFIPDIIRITSDTFTTSCLLYANGMSKELSEIAGINAQEAINYGTTAYKVGYAFGINEADESGLGFINSANPKTFKIGGASFKHSVGATYTWTAIGGLVEHAGYFYIQLALDGKGNLIVTGGVPAIEQLEIYIDGVQKTTVEYVHDETFTVDISALTDKNEHTVSVVAIGETLAELYPSAYYDTVTGYINPPPIYGVSGLYSATVGLTRTDDAVNLTYTVNSSSGTISSDFNSLFPWSEAKLVSDSAGNQFVQMPEMWFRVGTDSAGRITDIAVSAAKHDDGDWYQVQPFCYGRYGGYVSSDKLCSKSGYTRTASYARSAFRTYATNNGSNYHLLDLYHRTIMNFLWWIEFATKDSMSIMTGRINGSGISGGSTKVNTGGTNSVSTPSGFYRTYNQMRFHYIEDYIGNLMEWVDGIYASGSGSTNADYVTSDISQYGESTSGKTQTAYKNSGIGCIAAYGWDSDNPFLCTPTESVTNSSFNTYFCDYVYRGNTHPVFYTGAAYNASTTYNGIGYYYGASATAAYASIGGRLMYKGKLS